MNERYRRTGMTFFGILIVAFAVAVLRIADFGVDPFTVFQIGLWSQQSLAYGPFTIILTSLMLVAMFIMNRSKIGINTFLNILFFGYTLDFAWRGLLVLFPAPTLAVRAILLVFAVVILSFGSSLYIVADLGISPYDVIAVTLGERTRLPFKYWRIITDVICVAVGVFFGQKAGLGTIITALFMGPLIVYFNERVAWRLRKGRRVKAKL